MLLIDVFFFTVLQSLYNNGAVLDQFIVHFGLFMGFNGNKKNIEY